MAETIASDSFTMYIDGIAHAIVREYRITGTCEAFLEHPIPDVVMDLFGQPRVGELDRWANDGGPA